MANLQTPGIQLLKARATDGTDGYFTWNFPTGKASFQRAGTPDSATITLNALAPDGTSAIPITTATTAGAVLVEGLVCGQQYQAVISSAGGSTSLSAWLLAVN